MAGKAAEEKKEDNKKIETVTKKLCNLPLKQKKKQTKKNTTKKNTNNNIQEPITRLAWQTN